MQAIRFTGRLRKYLRKDHLNMMVNAFLCLAWIIVTVYIVAYLSEK